MQRNRTEDPIPPVSQKPTPILRLSNCKINSPIDQLQVGKKFEAHCDADFLHNSTPTNVKVEFEFITSYDENGKPNKENIYEKFYGYLDLNKKTQTFLITGNLPSPPSSPQDGTPVSYNLRGRHPEAEADVSCDEFTVKVIYPEELADQTEHIKDRTIEIKTADGGTLIGANYIICENGKVHKKGALDEKSQARYSAKQNCKYSVYLVNAGKIEKDKAG